MGVLVSVMEISFSPMGVVSVVVLFFLGMRNCSYWLKFKTQHEGIGILDAVNMARSRMLFPNYVRMIDFLINVVELEGSLVDVGCGVERLVANIVKTYPHIKGINFDVPHVVANAPLHPGVTHVGGDIFKEIPSAENIIIKSVLHDWDDEDCLRILKNCQKAVSQKKGNKVIIVDIVLHPDGEGLFDDAAIALDMLMMTNCIGGKERTENQWNKLLKEAGFTHLNSPLYQLQCHYQNYALKVWQDSQKSMEGKQAGRAAGSQVRSFFQQIRLISLALSWRLQEETEACCAEAFAVHWSLKLARSMGVCLMALAIKRWLQIGATTFDMTQLCRWIMRSKCSRFKRAVWVAGISVVMYMI
ncbi:chavicol O-methyltransferase-like [Beta vulgaris subsp. vulgaris]|uniref:chavicol O-methyltransferase-like n=1 Tax=Beta vulgaris subsp. vulgaris TaxID=3555 RepID=UPI0025494633|nr:chavicol O-methyltransferase-like [Beta vulgaris subsp. vulgaris]